MTIHSIARVCALLCIGVLALPPEHSKARAEIAVPAARVQPLHPKEEMLADLLARSQIAAAYEQALAWQKAEPKSALASYWVGTSAGQLAMTSGMFKAAGLARTSRKALEQAVQLDPGLVSAQFALMQFYLMAPGMMGGDEAEAERIAAKLAEISPVDGHRAQAVLLGRKRDADGQLAALERAVALDAGHKDAVITLASVHVAKANYQRAREIIEQALAVLPGHPALRYQQARLSAVSGENLPDGLKIIDELLALPRYPQDVPLAGAHFRRAQILAKLDRREDAIAAYEAALKVAPEFKPASEELKALRKAKS